MPDMTRRRFPKVLADELSAALAAVRDLDQELVTEWLARYRSNMVKSISAWGLFNEGSPVAGLQLIPAEHFQKIQQLDVAFKKLHHYRDGGAADYVAQAVAKEISRARSSLPRQHSRKADRTAVADFLRSAGYASTKNKKGLILQAMHRFGIKERTARAIAKQAGLTKGAETIDCN